MFITRGEVIHTIHGDNLPSHLSTFCQQEIRKALHKVIHDDYVYKMMKSSHLLDALDKLGQDAAELLVRLLFLADLIAGVQDRRMVAAAKEVADLRQ